MESIFLIHWNWERKSPSHGKLRVVVGKDLTSHQVERKTRNRKMSEDGLFPQGSLAVNKKSQSTTTTDQTLLDWTNVQSS